MTATENGTNQKHKAANPSLNAAMAALRAGRLDEAQARAREAAATKSSPERAWQILAAVSQRQGRREDAARAIQDGIAKHPHSAALYTMMGTLLRDAGRPEDAETALRHALSIDPQRSETALALGNVLAGMDRLTEAEELFRDGAQQAPADPRFPLQLGRIALTNRQPGAAKSHFTEAVNRSRAAMMAQPDGDASSFVQASTHLGELLAAEGKRLEALNYLDPVVRMGGDEAVRSLFATCLSLTPFDEALPDLKPLLVRALEEAWIPPAELARVCARQLLQEGTVTAAKDEVLAILRDGGAPFQAAGIETITADPLLHALLNTTIVPNPELEVLLAGLRGAFLRARIDPDAPHAKGAEGQQEFAVALANHCFLTEYAYTVTSDERAMADTLETRVTAAAESGEAIAMMDLVTLGMYRTLHRLDCAQTLLERSWPPALEPLVRRQLREPLKEAELRKTISRVTPISNEISTAVQAQYEENPFPRWVQTQVRHTRVSLVDWLGWMFPHMQPPNEIYHNPATHLDLLVAGCGTGQDAIAASMRFANSDVLAVDLSMTSLAYAARRSAELKRPNITFVQGDILELDGLGRQFDIVECAGVLHHLEDPIAGWRTLATMTKPGGYMLIALYSRQGRQDLDPATAFIAERGYGTSADELRRFRADVLALPANDPVRAIAMRRDDFYNLSMLRDLVFHVCERRFTIADIHAAIAGLGLEFGGFAAEANVMEAYHAKFGPYARRDDIENWEALEAENPQTFSAMYHFLVRKPG